MEKAVRGVMMTPKNLAASRSFRLKRRVRRSAGGRGSGPANRTIGGPSTECLKSAWNVRRLSVCSHLRQETPISAFALPDDVLEAIHQPGTSDLSATGVAELFGLQLQDLASMAAVHRNTVRTHPNTPRLQAVLRDLMRVLSAASVMQPDRDRALFLIKNAPIPAFRHKTILQLVAEGRTDDAVDYLESVSSGFVG